MFLSNYSILNVVAKKERQIKSPTLLNNNLGPENRDGVSWHWKTAIKSMKVMFLI
jgi:hypothetical protein